MDREGGQSEANAQLQATLQKFVAHGKCLDDISYTLIRFGADSPLASDEFLFPYF
jgi:hypothetical protein